MAVTDINLNAPLPCPRCGYDLRGTPGDRCPECGHLFDRVVGAPSTPWLRRRERRLLAFWRTVWIATWRPAHIGLDLAHAADFPAAFGFRRWLTGWLAPWPILMVALLYVDRIALSRYRRGMQSLIGRWSDNVIPDGRWHNHWTWWLEATCVLITLVMIVAWIGMCLGVPSYFFHPRRLPRPIQDRSIALSYFASAPLAWLPLAGFAALLIELIWMPNVRIWTWTAQPSPLGPEAQLAARVAQALPMLLIVALYLRSIGTLVRRTTDAGPARAFAAVATSAIAWPVLFLLFPIATLAALVLLQFIAFSAGWLDV